MTEPDFDLMRSVLVGDGGAGVSDIVASEARIREAQLTSDVSALDRLIADNVLFTGPDGNLSSKAQDLELFRSGVVRFLSHVPDELRVEFVAENVAIAALRGKLVVQVAGVRHEGTHRYTRVWVRCRDGVWQVAGGHVGQAGDQ